jgi:hypothetical protein
MLYFGLELFEPTFQELFITVLGSDERNVFPTIYMSEPAIAVTHAKQT